MKQYNINVIGISEREELQSGTEELCEEKMA